jgi:pSer/pThr/pTyr-binding forkhead associated (FHA) protein
MDILAKARRLESKIAGKLGAAAKEFVGSGAREPLEMVHAILDAIEQQIEPSGRGQRVFPFNKIELSLLASSAEARGRLEAVFAGDNPLSARIMERLRSAGCSTPDISVIIKYASRAQKNWRTREFDMVFARITQPDVRKPTHESIPSRFEVTVLRGATEQRTYSFVTNRIDLGRCAEVRDSRNRLIRTNHVAFIEGSVDVNQSVSRQHAHIAYEPSTGHFRLHDDGSGHGTGVLRENRTVPVPRGSRGVRLHSGDEIFLGEARLRVRFPTNQTEQS